MKGVMQLIIRKAHSFIKHIMDEISSVYWNFMLFPINIALQMPLKVNRSVDFVRYYKGCIDINAPISRHMIKFGEIGAPFIGKDKGSFFCERNGRIIITGPIVFAEGTKICVEEGKLTFGANAYFGCNSSFQCQTGITIGNNFLGGWNLCIRDTDGHPVIVDGKTKKKAKPINIGNHVWVGADSVILKGTRIHDDSIVACNSVVVGLSSTTDGCLIAGCPARIKKENIKWEM